MKILNIIIALSLSLAAFAQRDFQLAVERNVWFNSGNAASLTTFADSTISRAKIEYEHNSLGANTSLGKSMNGVNLAVESYMRLTPKVMAYGKASYSYTSIYKAGGSTIFGWETQQPFDIVEQPLTEDGSRSTLGDKQLQMFQFTGAVGWNVIKGLSIGAMVDFNAGSYVKQKDLRHNNSLMKLDARFSLMQKFSEKISAGASLLYKRNTETIQYKTYGTTDQTYNVFIDYANGIGLTEVFGENGFTDGKQEQPLVNDFAGTNVQFCITPFNNNATLLFDFSYLHRYGYYGKESQFTVSHANHTGNSYLWKARMNMPSTNNSHVTILEASLGFHNLTAYSTNYRQTKDQNNNAIIRYEYSTPTKISDHYLMETDIHCTSYFGKWQSDESRPVIYPWRLEGGINIMRSKQTGYLGLSMGTHDVTLCSPFIDAKRNIRLRSTDVLGIELRSSYSIPTSTLFLKHNFMLGGTLSYELPLSKFPSIRPVISTEYRYNSATPFRHYVAASIGANF